MLAFIRPTASALAIALMLFSSSVTPASAASANNGEAITVHTGLQPGISTRVYYENGERVEEVTEVIRVTDSKVRGKQYDPPKKCRTISPPPKGYVILRKGLCSGSFHVHAQAQAGKQVFAHVGVIDDRGKASYSSTGWSGRGGYSEGSVRKTAHCNKKCTVKLTHRVK